MYESVVRPILFKIDPETIHDWMLQVLWLAQYPFFYDTVSAFCDFEDPRLQVEAFGLKFENPVGMAAGFDKDCAIPDFLSAIGFGHVEFGTVTRHVQKGNPRPRIVRFPEQKALINRMGFPSIGIEEVTERLRSFYDRKRPTRIGINIGKLKETPLDDAADEYTEDYLKVKDFADYVVINVSSPNTPELRKLQEPERLKQLYNRIANSDHCGKPLLIKLAPDLSSEDLAGILDVCLSCNVSGVIATNTTLSRSSLSVPTEEAGGLSGEPLRNLSLKMVRSVYDRVGDRLPIIGVGGLSCGNDVIAMLKAGARMVQIYTGFVYGGPLIVKRIKQELIKYLEQNRIQSLQEMREAKD